MTKFLIYRIDNKSIDWKLSIDDKSYKLFRRSISIFITERHKIMSLVPFEIVVWESLPLL